MSMGIVSDPDFELERDKLDNVSKKTSEASPNESPIEGEVLDIPSKGRQKNSVEVPNSLRKLIGMESVENGRDAALELGRQFGISPSSVSAYTNGATSTKSYNDRVNAEAINGAKRRITKKARIKLIKALDYITEDKLAGAKPLDLSSIAKNMAGIIKDIEPSDDEVKAKSSPNFIIYSPQVRDERHFDVMINKE